MVRGSRLCRPGPGLGASLPGSTVLHDERFCGYRKIKAMSAFLLGQWGGGREEWAERAGARKKEGGQGLGVWAGQWLMGKLLAVCRVQSLATSSVTWAALGRGLDVVESVSS